MRFSGWTLYSICDSHCHLNPRSILMWTIRSTPIILYFPIFRKRNNKIYKPSAIFHRCVITETGSREGSNKNVKGTELLVDKFWIAGFCDGVDEPSNYTMKVNFLVWITISQSIKILRDEISSDITLLGTKTIQSYMQRHEWWREASEAGLLSFKGIDSTSGGRATWQKQTALNVQMLKSITVTTYESWNFNSGNYLFTTDTK